MKGYTKEELTEALRGVTFIISKYEKAQERVCEEISVKTDLL